MPHHVGPVTDGEIEVAGVQLEAYEFEMGEIKHIINAERITFPIVDLREKRRLFSVGTEAPCNWIIW